jgi:hypothetical protein
MAAPCRACIRSRSSLRELEAFSRSGLPVFFAFLHTRIARQEPGLLQDLPELGAEIDKSACDAMLYGAGLAVHSATFDIHDHIKFAQGVRSFEGLLHDHLVGLIEEVLI